MSTFNEYVSKFEAKEKEIKTLNEEFKAKESEFIREFTDKQNALKHEFESKITEAKLPVLRAMETYKAEQKAFFGVAHGETTDLLNMAKMIRKIVGLD